MSGAGPTTEANPQSRKLQWGGRRQRENGLVDKRTFRCKGNQPLTDYVGCALNTRMMKVQYLVRPRNNLEPDYNVPNNTGAGSDQDGGKM